MINFFARSLAARMMALFLAISLLPIAAIGIVSYWSELSSPKKLGYQKLHEAASLRKEQIIEYLSHERVSGAMDSIEQTMRQNVEGTRQLEAASINLEQLGQRLRDFLNRFKV